MLVLRGAAAVQEPPGNPPGIAETCATGRTIRPSAALSSGGVALACNIVGTCGHEHQCSPIVASCRERLRDTIIFASDALHAVDVNAEPLYLCQ